MKHLRSNGARRYAIGLISALIVVVAAQAHESARHQPAMDSSGTNRGRDGRPVAEAVFVKLLAESVPEGNALLMARVKDGQRQQFFIHLDDREILLRDDGQGEDSQAEDGTFSAIVNLDIQELRSNQERIRRLQRSLDRQLLVPIFDGRSKLAEREIESIELQNIRPGMVMRLLPSGIREAVDPEKSLLIRDPKVVEDPLRTFNPCAGAGTPMGKWTFGHLMEQMANQAETGVSPSQFVLKWLKTWQKKQTVNGFAVEKRKQIKNLIIRPWPKLPSGELDLSGAPFKLLAIVNRVDLRGDVLAGSSNAGEARFVFGALGPACEPLLFTVIFEYGIKRNGCAEVKAWAKQWLDMGSLELGSPDYNAALEAITEQFVRAGANPAKPNGSALNQLRTNEIALASPWELREFALSDQRLRQVTVKQTPDLSLNLTATLVDFINANEADIIAEKSIVPDQFPRGVPFLGGSSPMSGLAFWDGAGITSHEARHKFSLQTCSGCHQGETETGFTHIGPVPFGAAAHLSRFMTGIEVTDPVTRTEVRRFNEMERRAVDLDQLVNSSCLSQLLHKVSSIAH